MKLARRDDYTDDLFDNLNYDAVSRVVDRMSVVTRFILSITAHKYELFRPIKTEWNAYSIVCLATREKSVNIVVDLIMRNYSHLCTTYKLLIPELHLDKLKILISSFALRMSSREKQISYSIKIAQYAYKGSSPLGTKKFPPDNGNAIGLIKWFCSMGVLHTSHYDGNVFYCSQEAVKILINNGIVDRGDYLVDDILDHEFDCAKGLSNTDYLKHIIGILHSRAWIHSAEYDGISLHPSAPDILAELSKIDPILLINGLLCGEYKGSAPVIKFAITNYISSCKAANTYPFDENDMNIMFANRDE